MMGWNARSEPRRSQSDIKLVPGFVLFTCGVEYEGPDSVEVARDPNSWRKPLTFLPVLATRRARVLTCILHAEFRGHRPTALKECNLCADSPLQPLHKHPRRQRNHAQMSPHQGRRVARARDGRESHRLRLRFNFKKNFFLATCCNDRNLFLASPLSSLYRTSTSGDAAWTERRPALQRMASVSGSVAADKKHSLPSRSTDHMMDTQTSQDADTQLPSTPSEPALHQSRPKTRLPRLPPLPAEDYKLAIRPHGGLNLSKVSPKTLLLAVVHAANIRSEKPDIKLRVDENQNVLTISTSSEHIAMALGQITKITVHAATYNITSYGIAPDNSCKGVVNGIGQEITPDEFLTEVEVPGYEVLTCRRLGNSGAMVLTFCGKRRSLSS
ncbi:hypothetical protein HPB51_002116 [Rhipicephalus microplus]|uniref:Uncharacterized protein n=1 Tax=Rhipicephalus microplus TaxID=6941 RepID=A0A9J6DES5_RHIMP|nr:hypothetical protein HPB51_002116 [Rhipicephalus microplus]